MQPNKVGSLIHSLRLEQHLTQKQLANQMNISDKTISKWERGLGLPDVSLIPTLTKLLGVDIANLLEGEIAVNDFVNGNLKNTTYFVCPTCHNISFCTGNAKISCCGKKLLPLNMKKATAKDIHALKIESLENDWYITSSHPMTKTHYISFLAFVKGDVLQIIKLYPEWNIDVRIQKNGHGMLVWYCIKHGLFYQIV